MVNIVDKFLSFYKKKDHKILPSSNVTNNEDKSILFVNSGMVQFKDYFLGKNKPLYQNITTCQKCVRAGGKHNDFENIGYTNRHHTFFEMLGNFSFGGYFKKEAINYAWELLVNELKIDPKRLFATVCFSNKYNDEESYSIWKEIYQKHNLDYTKYITKVSTEDNFWQMGHDGLSGPCTEIYYDYQPDSSLDDINVVDDELRFIEIYNVVFTQFNKVGDTFEDLPVKCVDTGMGLERVESVLNVKSHGNNYLSGNLLKISEKLYEEIFIFLKKQNAKHDQLTFDALLNEKEFKVVVDHLRSIVFILSEKILPSNKKQGYILKKLIKKMILNLGNLMNKLCLDFNISFSSSSWSSCSDQVQIDIINSVSRYCIDIYSERYEELIEVRSFVDEVLISEYWLFTKILERALKIFNENIKKLLNEKKSNPNALFSGDQAFELEDTYGLDIEILRDLCRKYAINIDQERFDERLKEQKLRSKKSNADFFDNNSSMTINSCINMKFNLKINSSEHDISFENYDKRFTELIYYNKEEIAELDALIIDKIDKNIFLFDKTIFYPEGGGQIYDTGLMQDVYGNVADVVNVQKINQFVYHQIKLTDANKDKFKIGHKIKIKVDIERRSKIKINHSATHILDDLLKKHIGEIVEQKGSFLNDKYLTFDFSCHKNIDSELIYKIESEFNEIIKASIDSIVMYKTFEEAKSLGAVFLNDKNYSNDKVRLLKIGSSLALCGGLHINNTAEIRFFKIISESGIASNIRRITAVTGDEVVNMLYYYQKTLSSVANLFNNTSSYKIDDTEDIEIVKNCEKLINEKKQLNVLYNNCLENLIKNKIDSSQFDEINSFKLQCASVPNIDLNKFNHSILYKTNEKKIIFLYNKNSVKIYFINYSENINGKKFLEYLKKEITHIKGGGTDSFLTIILDLNVTIEYITDAIKSFVKKES